MAEKLFVGQNSENLTALPEFGVADEANAIKTKTARSAIKATEIILGKQLGIQIDLSSPGRVVFKQWKTIENTSLKQATDINPLAQTIIDRNLPLPITTNTYGFKGILLTDQEKPTIAVSFTDIGVNFKRILPINRNHNEALSCNSMFFFRNLVAFSVLSLAKPVEFTRSEATIQKLREQLIDAINSYAQQGNQSEIADLATEIERDTADISRLSITGKGADITLNLDGKPLYSVQRSSNIGEFFMAATESAFIKEMTSRNLWFVAPQNWKNDFPFDQLSLEQALEGTREENPYWEVPEDPRQFLELFISGELIRRDLVQLAGDGSLSVIANNQPAPPVHEIENNAPLGQEKPKGKNKKKPKNKSNPKLLQKQSFKRLPKPARIPDTTPNLTPNLVTKLRHDPPPELEFITEEIAEILRKDDWKAFVRNQRRQAREAVKARRSKRVQALKPQDLPAVDNLDETDLYDELIKVIDSVRYQGLNVNQRMKTLLDNLTESKE